MWLTLYCASAHFLDGLPRTVLSDPALEPDEICSFLGILMIKPYSLVSVSVQGFSLVITQPSTRCLASGNPFWEGLQRSGCLWTAACMSSGAWMHMGLECEWRTSRPQFSPSWQCELIVLEDFCPYLGQWPHYPRVWERVSMGFCLRHSLLSLFPLCRKCHFAEVINL